MGRNAAKVMVTFFAVLIGFMLSVSPAFAIWQALLDEHFDKDQQNDNLRWPWVTHPQTGWRWHWNPMGNWPRREGNLTISTWGFQDAYYNSHVRQDEEITASIWCAYTDRRGRDFPRWPEDNEYLNNQNAWTWWGPMDTREWTGGAVSYWYYIHLDRYARDSLSVILVDDDRYLTTESANTFRTRCGIGKTYARGTGGDWEFNYFYFDSAYVDGELTSYLDEREVWLAFVWHSNNRDIAGTGAYIDDVIISWDDGLFEIYPKESLIGYEVNEDSTHWTRAQPEEGDHIQFRLDWRVEGNGETPPFDINCYLNDEMIYTEEVTPIAGTDTVYSSIADTTWEVVPGEYVITWELDAPAEDGGEVEESNEENNIELYEFEIAWNPPPQFEILTPEEEMTRIDREPFQIHWTLSDSNEFDAPFTVYLYWTKDTTGLAEVPDTVWSYNYISHTFRAEDGEDMEEWNYRPVVADGEIQEHDTLWVVGFAADGFPGNRTIGIAPGTLFYDPEDDTLSVGRQDDFLPEELALTRTFPNPFNRTATIEYAMPNAGDVWMSVLDMSGRAIATLVNGKQGAGMHTIAWQPDGIPAGVYLVRLQTLGETILKKVVYMP